MRYTGSRADGLKAVGRSEARKVSLTENTDALTGSVPYKGIRRAYGLKEGSFSTLRRISFPPDLENSPRLSSYDFIWWRKNSRNTSDVSSSPWLGEHKLPRSLSGALLYEDSEQACPHDKTHHFEFKFENPYQISKEQFEKYFPTAPYRGRKLMLPRNTGHHKLLKEQFRKMQEHEPRLYQICAHAAESLHKERPLGRVVNTVIPVSVYCDGRAKAKGQNEDEKIGDYLLGLIFKSFEIDPRRTEIIFFLNGPSQAGLDLKEKEIREFFSKEKPDLKVRILKATLVEWRHGAKTIPIKVSQMLVALSGKESDVSVIPFDADTKGITDRNLKQKRDHLALNSGEIQDGMCGLCDSYGNYVNFLARDELNLFFAVEVSVRAEIAFLISKQAIKDTKGLLRFSPESYVSIHLGGGLSSFSSMLYAAVGGYPSSAQYGEDSAFSFQAERLAKREHLEYQRELKGDTPPGGKPFYKHQPIARRFDMGAEKRAYYADLPQCYKWDTHSKDGVLAGVKRLPELYSTRSVDLIRLEAELKGIIDYLTDKNRIVNPKVEKKLGKRLSKKIFNTWKYKCLRKLAKSLKSSYGIKLIIKKDGSFHIDRNSKVMIREDFLEFFDVKHGQ